MGKQENEEHEFDFIKEKIKNKPVNKRRLFMRMGYHILSAAVFGAVACIVFVLLRPYAESWLHPQESAISTPEEPEAEEPEEPAEEPEPQEPVNQTVYVPEELDAEDYQELQKKLYSIGKQANKSMVTVTGVTGGTDWFNMPYENQASGVIIANSGQELLILTEKKAIADAQSISITFIDGQKAAATLRKYDGNTGIAVVTVPLSSVSGATMGQIAAATLGNSQVLSQGTVVIAIGSPLGTNYSILSGTITSTQNKVSTIDNNYTVFNTDMVGSESGSGVLVNLGGEVVGFLMQGYNSGDERNTITAFSISELQPIINALSANQDIPYLGLNISTVTNEIANQYELPKGVYVSNVGMDSPAMGAGIQAADVIVKMNGKEITSVEQYSQMLMTLRPGDTVSLSIERQGAEGYVELACPAVVGVLQ